jgi:hypothetical protein
MHRKVAKILGLQTALVEFGFLDQYPSYEKAAQDASIAAAATPDEVGVAGQYITPEDLASLEKILGVLSELQMMYQQQAGPQAPMQQPMPQQQAAPIPGGGQEALQPPLPGQGY